jgi:ABC-type bacteriocin/lantibiotic exporter with double-glycine peptidase domain
LQALLNFAGLTAFVPVLISALDPGKSNTIPICIAVFIFIVIKNLVSVWLSKFQIRYVNRIFCHFSEKLYVNYFRRGFLFVKESLSTSLSHNVNGVCYQFAQGVLSLSLTMAGEALLLLLIWGGLLIYSFKIALLIACCFVPVVWIYLQTVRNKLQLYGKAENQAKWKQWHIVTETFKGYTEVELNRVFPMFRRRFKDGLNEIAFYREHTDHVLRIPGSMIECYVAAGMMVAVILIQGNSDLRITFGIIAVGVLRMLPALRTLIGGWTQLKNNVHVIDIIEEAQDEAEMEPEGGSAPISFRKQIEVNNITFRFPDTSSDDPPVINHFSMTIGKGERVGIRGTSGIGKSTLFNLLLGFYEPQSGEIRIDDIPLDHTTRASWHALVGYVPQDVFIMDGTLAENVAFGESVIDEERVSQVLKQAQLDEFIGTLPEGIHAKLGENGCRLSGGQRQRIGIARALYKQVEVLFFDEATSSLDPQTEQEITIAIRELSSACKELTLIMIAHRESSLAFCNRIITLE